MDRPINVEKGKAGFQPGRLAADQRASAPPPDGTAGSNQCPHCSTGGRDLAALLSHLRVMHPEHADQFEPAGMEVTDNRGSWNATCDGLNSNTYSSREAAIRGWHRNDRERVRDRAVQAGSAMFEAAIRDLGGLIDGPVTFGYIGNVDPSGRNDSRLWSLFASGWRRPRSIYPSNSVMVTIGTTDDIANMTPDKADDLTAKLVADVLKGIEDGSVQPRAYSGS